MKDARREWLSQRGAILAIGVVFAGFLFATLDRSPGSDEMWFYYQVKRLIETGTPWISPDGTLKFLHPPLYPLLLSIPIKILGMHRWTACIVGILCATGILVASERMTRRMQRLPAAIVLAAIAWNPAFIQAALLLDSDNTLIAASCFLLLLLALNWYDRPPKGLEIAGGILLAAVAFGSKWTTPLILPAMAVLFLPLKQNGRRAGATLAIAIAAGFSLFLILFLFYCSMTGLNSELFLSQAILATLTG